MEALLRSNSLRQYFPAHSMLFRQGTFIPLVPKSRLGCKCSSSPLVERKGKKLSGSSSVETKYDDGIVLPSGKSSIGVFVQ